VILSCSRTQIFRPRMAVRRQITNYRTFTKFIGRDVRVETATRMSAAFPYVSPAARADAPWNAEHLVDGGYFD